MSFGGWDDDLAGLHYYEYQVFDLGHDGTSLIDGQNVVLGTERLEITDSSVSIFISFNLRPFTMTHVLCTISEALKVP